MNDQQRDRTSVLGVSFWRKRNLVRGLGIVGVVAGVATGTWAVEETAKVEAVGLRGILSSTAPAELSADEFAKLNGNWAEWSQGTATAVSEFYAKLETADVAGQRAALKGLKAKIDVMQRAIDDPRYVSLIEPLVLMHGRLAQRVAIAEAVLDTLELDPANVRTAKLSTASKDVAKAIASLKVDLARTPNGNLWLPYVKADLIEKSFAKSPSDDAAIAAVRAAKARIAGRSNLADEKQKEFLGGKPFLNYEAALDQYLAGVDWKPPTVDAAEVRGQLKKLLDAIDSYADTRSSEDAAAIRDGYVAIGKVTLDGGDLLSAALQKYVMNYNVRILASEDFLNRLMMDVRTEKGPVTDFVMGANVSGNQTTATKVTVDLLPSATTARFDLTLTGNIQSSTVGVTSEATVYTQGNHQFVAKKEVNFDGHKFVTLPATINVYPHNTTTGIATNVGGLFQGIAQGVASQEVEKRRPQAEAIAADRVRTNVLPKFNSEVDKNLKEAEPKLESEVFAGLKATGLYPDAFVYQSTSTVIRLNSRLMGAHEAGANLPRAVITPERGATLLMHESAVNNAINRMDLAGQTLTEPELKAKMEAFFSKALSREVKFAAPKNAAPAESDDGDKGPSAIIFAAADPIRVAFENGELTLTIKAGFKQEGKDDIPTREITVPISFAVKGKTIVATRGDITVAALDGQGGGIAINGVVRKKIQSALPDREFDSKVDLKGPKNTVTTHVSNIRMVDGWVVIAVD